MSQVGPTFIELRHYPWMKFNKTSLKIELKGSNQMNEDKLIHSTLVKKN